MKKTTSKSNEAMTCKVAQTEQCEIISLSFLKLTAQLLIQVGCHCAQMKACLVDDRTTLQGEGNWARLA
ncbi:hypothetical protein ACFX1S_004007 [Malus domestica]